MSSPVCGYYGKLPVSPEFLRLHAAGSELRWLDAWIQKGMLYAQTTEGMQWPTRIAEADTWNFMYVPSGAERTVCGTLFASRDKAGRSFPFLCFILLDHDTVAEHVWLGPIVATAFLEYMAATLPLLRETFDWQAFSQKFEGFVCPDVAVANAQALERYAQYARSTTVHDLCVSFWGTFDDSRKYRLEAGLRSHIQRSRRLKGRMVRAIKLPLPRTIAENETDPFWLASCLHVFRRPPHSDIGMLVFWNQKPKKVEPCAVVSMGPGSSNVARFIVSPDGQDNAWYDLLGEDENAEVVQEEDSVGSIMDEADLTVEGLLDALATAS